MCLPVVTNSRYLLRTDHLRSDWDTGGSAVGPVPGDDGAGAARDDGGGAQHRQDAKQPIQGRQLQQRVQGGEGVKWVDFGRL